MGDVGPHFDRVEFRCKGHGKRGHRAHSTPVEHRLVHHLEQLRQLVGGRPLTIVSGHRCSMWNKRVGGATRSQHMTQSTGFFNAADIPRGYATVAQAKAAGFTGIGSKDGWAVHVDVRPGPVVVWTY